MAELEQRLVQLRMGTPGRDDAESRVALGAGAAIEPCGAHESLRGRQSHGLGPVLHGARVVGPAQVRAVGREREGRHGPGAVWGHVHRGRALADRAGELQAHPAAAVARERPAGEAELEDLGEVRRRQHRHQAVDEFVFGLVPERRGLGEMVVAGCHQHAAERRGAGVRAVLDRVHGAIDTRVLGVPEREHALHLRLREQRHLLRAPAGGCGQLLVEPGHEAHVVLLEQGLGAPQFAVEPADRRAAISADEPARGMAARAVAARLLEQQPHQRLHAREVDLAFGLAVFVVERDGSGVHEVRAAASR